MIAACRLVQPDRGWTGVSVRIRVGDPYPGAALKFRGEPVLRAIPDTKVYVAPGRNLYRYGRYWYFVEDGYWFRARSWTGPFIHIHSKSVPRPVRTLPAEHRLRPSEPSPRTMASDTR